MIAAAWRWLTRPRGRAGHRFHGVARARSSRAGIALLLVITSLMFMTVLVTETSFGARVRFLRSAHQRDKLAAYWLARTGVNIYRLVLVADRRISDQFGQYLEAMGLPSSGALWQMVPAINTGLLRMLFVSGGSVDDQDVERFKEQGLTDEQRAASREGGSRFENRNFLDFDGDFAAELTDEDSRIWVPGLAGSSASLTENPYAMMLYGLMSGQDQDQWFYEHGLDRWELIGNLKDWIDTDTSRSTAEGGYEDNLYNRLDPPYLAKNAGFDTTEEIRMVEGWQDEVYDRFRDAITIYGGGKVNVNTAGDEVLKALFRTYIQPPPDDTRLDQIIQELRETQALVGFNKGSEFVDWLGQFGTVDPGLASMLSTKSTVFRVSSVGVVGDSEVRIVAVMDFSSSSEGRIVYWRVD